MRQAIVTKYLGPTNTRGARVKATADAGSVIIGWDHALNSDQNHTRAARKLAEHFGWFEAPFVPKGVNVPVEYGIADIEFLRRWVAGGLPDNAGNAYVRHEG